MTVEETIKKLLVKNGMFPKQADAVMARVKAKLPEMEGRWQDPASDYSPAVIVGVWINAKNEGLDWIDENLPKAFFRPMFAQP